MRSHHIYFWIQVHLVSPAPVEREVSVDFRDLLDPKGDKDHQAERANRE